MNHEIITELLNKYFEGDTSLEEEAQLKEYFNSAEVHPSLRIYQPLFQFFEQEQQIGLSTSFDEQLLAKLQHSEPTRLRLRRLSLWIARAAAIVLIAVSAWQLYQYLNRTDSPPIVTEAIDWSKYEPETPEEAYQILKTSLEKASAKLNEGTDTATKGLGKVKKITEIIQ